MTIEMLQTYLPSAWNAITSYDPAWTESNPPLGQCAVTALVINDACGGKICKGVVAGASHYWNEVDNHNVDLTFEQFEPGSTKTFVKYINPAALLRDNNTADRYRQLKANLNRVCGPVIDADTVNRLRSEGI